MSICTDCEAAKTAFALESEYQAALIERKKVDARTWAELKNFKGLLYIVKSINGYGFKKLAETEGREIVDTILIH